MKVRVSYTVELNDDARKLIASMFGESGKADRGTIALWFQMHGDDRNSLIERMNEASEDYEAEHGEVLGWRITTR